ncbi:MAG: cyclic lactone autoinducer peptide [Lachnospiraceae bacterium]|nr:cyclic lactone autoinducer peptide [Lachnospiraceae bacterium]
MKFKTKFLKGLCAFAVIIAQLSVNSTCAYHFYQDELSPELNSLRKYHEE